MYKILVDSDALIKMAKACFLRKATATLNLWITQEVLDEAVTQGKQKFLADASDIEELLVEKRIRVIDQKTYLDKKKPTKGLGKGEISIYQAYSETSVIITDDYAFISLLEEEQKNWISSGHVLLLLVEKKELTNREALQYLERLKPLVRKEIYFAVKKDIGG